MAFFQADNLWIELQDDTAFLRLDVPGKSLNVLNRQALADIGSAVDRIMAQPAVRRLIITSAKPSGFLAGADVHEFAAHRGPQDATDAVRPRTAAVRQAGGTDHSLHRPGVRPVPGRRVGAGAGVRLSLGGRASENAVRPAGDQTRPAARLGRHAAAAARHRRGTGPGGHPRPAPARGTGRLPLGSGRRGDPRRKAGRRRGSVACQRCRPRNGRRLACRSAPGGRSCSNRPAWAARSCSAARRRSCKSKTPDDMPAPREAFEAVRIGVTTGMAAGLAHEREAIGRLATTTACRNLVALFFEMESAKQMPAELAAVPAREIKRVGIVGAGTHGGRHRPAGGDPRLRGRHPRSERDGPGGRRPQGGRPVPAGRRPRRPDPGRGPSAAWPLSRAPPPGTASTPSISSSKPSSKTWN